MRKLKKFGIVMMVLAVAVAAFEVGSRWMARRTIERHLAAIRAMGYPATFEELDALYPEPPEGENAAEIYLEAFGLAKSVPGGNARELDLIPYVWKYAEVPALDQPFPPESLAAATKYLAARPEVLAKLHEGAQLPKARYRVELQQGYNVVLSHLEGISQGIGLLAVEAAVRAEQGDADGAVDSLWAAMRLAESLAEEPVQASQMRRVQGHEIVLNATQRVLSRTAPGPEAVARFAQMVADVEGRDTFHRAVMGDVINTFAYFTQEEAGYLEPVIDVAWKIFPPIRVADFEQYAGRVPAVLRAAQGSPAERRRCAMGARTSFAGIPWYCVISRMSGSEQWLLMVNVRDIAGLRAARVGLALERYRLAHGALPNRLDDLAPEFLDVVPLDPFSDGPFQYLVHGNGFVVYSLGEDSRDSGGITRQEAQDRNLGYNAGDIPFEVRR